MEANFTTYDHKNSDERIQEILNSTEAFEELADIPSRDRLTYSNGFYVNCTAVFIDIRGSSELANTHTRPVLGKLYRAYLSECVAVMNGDSNCREIFINGDCVSGIFSTPYKTNINEAFSAAARLNSVTKLLNWRLEQKGYTTFRCGIGMAYGRALMLKAGYKGSGINDVIWMGDVVNEASNLCHDASRGYRKTLQASETFYLNLTTDNQGLLSPVYDPLTLRIENYEGNVVNKVMEEYLDALKDNAARARSLAQLLAFGQFGVAPPVRRTLLGG